MWYCSLWQTCYMSPIPFCPSQVFQLFPLSSLTCSEAQRATELFPIFCYSRSYSVRSFSFFPACAMSPGHVASAFLVFLSHDMNIHVPCCFFFLYNSMYNPAVLFLIFQVTHQWGQLLSCYQTLKYTQFSFFEMLLELQARVTFLFFLSLCFWLPFIFFQKSTKKPSHFD